MTGELDIFPRIGNPIPQRAAIKQRRRQQRQEVGMIAERLTKPGSFADFPNSFRRDMAADGFHIIEPDGKTFRSFNLRNWHMASFLARKVDTIYVPLIHARKPQHGAFSKLLHDVRMAGLKVAVVAPLGTLQTILANWLYEPRRELICGSVEDVWRHPEGI